eukprot:1788604-Amphidinium_carterae.1
MTVDEHHRTVSLSIRVQDGLRGSRGTADARMRMHSGQFRTATPISHMCDLPALPGQAAGPRWLALS